MQNATPSNVTLRLHQLPFLVRLAVGLSYFSAWVIFEEGIVDRTGLWELMPGYLRARLCPWDLAALGIILVPLVFFGRRRGTATAEVGPAL